jgi:hypothetical protein
MLVTTDSTFSDCPNELHIHHLESDWCVPTNRDVWIRPIQCWVHDPVNSVLDAYNFYVCGKAGNHKEDLEFYSKEHYDALMDTF